MKLLEILILHQCTKNMLGCRVKAMTDTSFWADFCPFSTWQVLQLSFLKNKKMPKGIMILHQSTNNYDHIMLGCGDTALD